MYFFLLSRFVRRMNDACKLGKINEGTNLNIFAKVLIKFPSAKFIIYFSMKIMLKEVNIFYFVSLQFL